MGFFERVWNIIRGNADSALTRLEDPEKSLNLAIKDATDEVERFRKQVARALVDQKRLEAELQTAATSTDEWTRRAQSAVAAGDDDLAREALSRRAHEEEGARRAYGALQQQAASVGQLKDALRGLTLKLEEAKRKRNVLIARSRNAQAQLKMADALGGTGAGALQRFDELEAKVQTLEIEASASVDMLSTLGSTSEGDLERRFKALPTRDASIEAALAEMKTKKLPVAPAQGLLPKGSGGGPSDGSE